MRIVLAGKKRWGMLLALMIAACSPVLAQPATGVPTPPPADTTSTSTIAESTPLPGNLDGVTFIEDNQTYFISQLLPRDGIFPIYEPEFTTAADSTFAPDELIMGLAINGDARAYPVGVLRSREMVNDVVGGTPVLVTW